MGIYIVSCFRSFVILGFPPRRAAALQCEGGVVRKRSMANRFCASCGAAVLGNANFCVECGERLPGAKAPRAGFSFPIQRYAPLLIVATVVAVGGGAVVLGVLGPK